MRNRTLSACVAVAIFGLVGMLGSSRAQAQFNQFTQSQIYPDFNSGFASVSVDGQNAVPTNVTANAYLNTDTCTGLTTIYTNINVSGFWGTYSPNNPFYQILQNQGLNASTSFHVDHLVWNGDWYDIVNPVRLDINGRAGIFQDSYDAILSGNFGMTVNAIGAIPLSTTATYQVNEPGHPSWLPDWQVTEQSTWALMTPITQTPAPGSVALLGLGGLMSARRRR